MPFPLLLVALLFLALPLRAQEKENTVLLTAHLVDGEDDKALLAPWGVNFICDALDQAVVAIPDSTGYVELRLPRGKCVVIPEFYYPVTLNLTADTIVERLELTYDAFNRSNIYRSRHKKDSTLRAEEAALKADLHYVDTSYSFLDPDPNYYLLAQLYEYDLHYPLPRWRTFSRDSALHYLRYSYHQNPERYDYLYYPICQLEHALGLPHDRKVRRPKAPDSRWYAPLPEVKDGWIVDTITSYMDLYDRARNMSHHLALELAPQGEKSLVYPRRKKPAVRILYSGGLGNSTAIRIEDGRLHYASCDIPWRSPDESHWRERWSVKLSRAEIDTMLACLDSLHLLGDQNYLADNIAIDAQNIHIEYTDHTGYHYVDCFEPHKHPETAPIHHYLHRLYRRHSHLLTIGPIVNGPYNLGGVYTIDGKNIHLEANDGGFSPRHIRLPEGSYSIRAKAPGFEPQVFRLRLQADTTIDTLRLKHRSIDLKVNILFPGGAELTGPMLLYVAGVDTTIVEENPGPRIATGSYPALFRHVPTGSQCFIVEDSKRVGGYFHTPLLYIADSIEHADSLTMTLDRSRRPFRSAREKDSTLRAEAQKMYLSGIDMSEDLGKLYYFDHLLFRMSPWHTFDSACTNAYHLLSHAYRLHPDKHYLYYPLRQLQFDGNLKADPSLQPPAEDSLRYLPLPADNLTPYSLQDILSPLEENAKEARRMAQWLAPLGEPSLLYPKRQGPLLRLHHSSSYGDERFSFRIENDTLFSKHLFSTFLPADPFDTTIDPNPSLVHDTITLTIRPLSPAECDSLRLLLQAMADADLSGSVGASGHMHAVMEYYEYIVDGKYRFVNSLAPWSVPLLRRLRHWLLSLTQP